MIFNKLYLKRYMERDWLCEYQHAEKVASDNMGLVDLAVMATGFYHLLACQASDVCWENC